MSRRYLGEVCGWKAAVAPKSSPAGWGWAGPSPVSQDDASASAGSFLCFLARVWIVLASLLLTWHYPRLGGLAQSEHAETPPQQAGNCLFTCSLCCSLSVGFWGDHVGDCDPRANPLCWHWECRNLQLPHQWEQAEAAAGVPGRCVSTSLPCWHMIPWEVWLAGRKQGQLAGALVWIYPLSSTQRHSLESLWVSYQILFAGTAPWNLW